MLKVIDKNIFVKNSSKIVTYNTFKAKIPPFYTITGFYKRFSREHYKRNFKEHYYKRNFIASFISINIIKVIYTYALFVSYNSNLFYSPIGYRTIYNAI